MQHSGHSCRKERKMWMPQMISKHDACILVVNYALPVVIKGGFLLESSPDSEYSETCQKNNKIRN